MTAAEARAALLAARRREKFLLESLIRERQRGGPHVGKCLLARNALRARSLEARQLYRAIVAIERRAK